jgi:hypothetical protein
MSAGCSLAMMAPQALAQQSFPRPIVLYRAPSGANAARGPVTFTTSKDSLQSPNVNQSMNANSNSSSVMTGPANSGNPAFANAAAIRTAQMTGGMTGGMPPGMTGGMTAGSSQADPRATQGFANPASNQSSNQVGTTGSPGQTTDSNMDSQRNSSGNNATAQQFQPSLLTLQNPSGLYNMSHSGITSSQQYAPNLYFGQQFRTWTNQQTMDDSPASYNEMSRFQVGPNAGYVAPNTYLGSGFSSWNNLSSGRSETARRRASRICCRILLLTALKGARLGEVRVTSGGRVLMTSESCAHGEFPVDLHHSFT